MYFGKVLITGHLDMQIERKKIKGRKKKKGERRQAHKGVIYRMSFCFKLFPIKKEVKFFKLKMLSEY